MCVAEKSFFKKFINIRVKKQLRRGIHFYDDPLAHSPCSGLNEKNQHIKRIIVKLFIILPLFVNPFFYLCSSIDDCCHCADKNKNFSRLPNIRWSSSHHDVLEKISKNLATKGFHSLQMNAYEFFSGISFFSENAFLFFENFPISFFLQVKTFTECEWN